MPGFPFTEHTVESAFTEHTVESAPPAARRFLTGPLPDERLDAIRVFTLRVLDTAGDVGDPALQDFLARGYTAQNALEVVLGIGTYTMSTLANRLTGAPMDAQLAAYA